MFERFTDRARRAVVLAQEEARLLDHGYIGSEHLLLGLLHDGDGVAAIVLLRHGVDRAGARIEVEQVAGRGGHAPSGHIPFTGESKSVLEQSLREALMLGDQHIGEEHLLLGLLAVPDNIGMRVLQRFGVDFDRLRTDVVELRSDFGAEVRMDMETSDAEGSLVVVSRSAEGSHPMPWTPSTACAFCSRDLYEVDRVVTNGRGVLLCHDCARLALEVMDRAPASAPVQPLRLPPRVSGAVPDATAVDEIVALVGTRPFGGPAQGDALPLVSPGDGLGPVQAELQARWGHRPDAQTFVERVRFVSSDEAAVRFTISALPGSQFDGRVVRDGGPWKLGRETYCQIAQLGGVQCPEYRWSDDRDD